MACDTPYRSLIVSFKVRAGKTFTTVCLTHLYIKEDLNFIFKFFHITINNFNNEYKNICRLFKFIYNKNDNNITSFTYAKVNNSKEIEKSGLIILDEEHNLNENGIKFKKNYN